MVILMIDKLKQQEKEVQEKIKAWEDFETSKNKYYKVPNPNKLGYGFYTKTDVNKFNIPECKKKLDYLKLIAKYYDNNDYVIDIDDIICKGITEDFMENTHITQEVRDRLHGIIDNLEAKIRYTEDALEK